MFPLEDEIFIEDPLIFQQEKLLEDLLEDPDLLGGNYLTSKGTKKRQRTNSVSNGIQGNKDEGVNESKKKIMHRDVERRRRHEMAGLYASLRSLLPLQYIKGKRSVSDHMHEAVNYIKHMQKSVKELQVRRDKLKELFHLPRTNVFVAKDGNLNNDSHNHVEVNLCCDDIEILITSGLNVEYLPLSRVLVELLERDLNVIGCVSTRSNNGSFHRIQIEAKSSDVDLHGIQERLANVINYQPCLKS